MWSKWFIQSKLSQPWESNGTNLTHKYIYISYTLNISRCIKIYGWTYMILSFERILNKVKYLKKTNYTFYYPKCMTKDLKQCLRQIENTILSIIHTIINIGYLVSDNAFLNFFLSHDILIKCELHWLFLIPDLNTQTQILTMITPLTQTITIQSFRQMHLKT